MIIDQKSDSLKCIMHLFHRMYNDILPSLAKLKKKLR